MEISSFVLIFFISATILPIVLSIIVTAFTPSVFASYIIIIVSLSVGVICLGLSDTRQLWNLLSISVAIASFQLLFIQTIMLNMNSTNKNMVKYIFCQDNKSYIEAAKSSLEKLFSSLIVVSAVLFNLIFYPINNRFYDIMEYIYSLRNSE